MNVADGWSEIMQSAARGLLPDPELLLDQWAEEHIVLRPPAAMAGPYRLAHTPMARRVLQALSQRDPCKRVVVRGASQMLKTQVFICAALGWIARAPANILALEPTLNLAKRLSARVTDAVAACDAAAATVAAPRSRDARNTLDAKEFAGGTLYITTAGSAANLAEIPARYVFADEVDRMDDNVGGEGDPVDLAEARTTTFEGIAKIYIVSSPTVQNASKIDKQFERGTQEHYQVPCPHCGELHELVLEYFRYARDDSGLVQRAWFVCPNCGAEIEESAKPAMLRDEALGGTARWIARAPGDGETVSFHISAFYAPPGSVTWLGLARQLARAEDAEAQGNVEPMRVFHNTRLALSFAYKSNLPDSSALRERAESYPELTVAAGGLVATAGVDVQHDRLAVVIRAWGRGEESWLVYWGEIHGSTAVAGAGAWVDLVELLDRPLPHALGGTLRLSAVSIDGSDGNRTEVVHAVVRPRRHKNWMAVKGAAEQTNDRREIFAAPKMADIGKRLKPARFGLQTFIVGTARAKDLILETRLDLQGGGPGRIHVYAGVRADYWDQVTSEVKIPTGPKRRMTWTKKGGVRNEALDCEVYALHAARSQRTHLLREAHWTAIEQRLRQRTLLDQPDLAEVADAVVVAETPQAPPPVQTFAQPETAPEIPPPPKTPAAPATRRVRRGGQARQSSGFVNGW